MKTVIRLAPLFAGVILALVVFAFLDRIPDDPGVFKERCLQQVQSVGLSDPAYFDTASAILTARAVPSRNICAGMSLFDAESTIASAGIGDLRSAADSSPPASAS